MLLSSPPPPHPSHQAEVDVNTPVDVASLVSSGDLPARERQGQEADAGVEDERERFYLTTAINYTNGTIFCVFSGPSVLLCICVYFMPSDLKTFCGVQQPCFCARVKVVLPLLRLTFSQRLGACLLWG